LLRWFYLLVILLLSLQSCQYQADLKAEQLVSIRKHNDAALYNTQLGLAYLKQGHRSRAKRKLLTALKAAPNLPEANVAMAYFFEKTGDLVTAKIYYQKTLSLAPNNGAQLNNYGAYLCRIGQYKEADSYFLKAVGDINYIHTAGAYENAGLCATALGDYDKAKRYFEQALAHDPDRQQSLFELTKIALQHHQSTHALANLQKYHALSSDDPMLLTIARDAARQAGRGDIEASYMQRLSQLDKMTDYTGAQHEYDSSNG
jgi:type IV pilus assembly protein PilF